eukprot:m51a1_g829 putative domain containing protein (1855) ;mRNA; r:724480-733854
MAGRCFVVLAALLACAAALKGSRTLTVTNETIAATVARFGFVAAGSARVSLVADLSHYPSALVSLHVCSQREYDHILGMSIRQFCGFSCSYSRDAFMGMLDVDWKCVADGVYYFVAMAPDCANKTRNLTTIPKLTASVNYTLLNPGNEHLSAENIGLPGLYRAWSVIALIATLGTSLMLLVRRWKCRTSRPLELEVWLVLVLTALLVGSASATSYWSRFHVSGKANAPIAYAANYCLAIAHTAFVMTFYAWSDVRTSKTQRLGIGLIALMVFILFEFYQSLERYRWGAMFASCALVAWALDISSTLLEASQHRRDQRLREDHIVSDNPEDTEVDQTADSLLAHRPEPGKFASVTFNVATKDDLEKPGLSMRLRRERKQRAVWSPDRTGARDAAADDLVDGAPPGAPPVEDEDAGDATAATAAAAEEDDGAVVFDASAYTAWDKKINIEEGGAAAARKGKEKSKTGRRGSKRPASALDEDAGSPDPPGVEGFEDDTEDADYDSATESESDGDDGDDYDDDDDAWEQTPARGRGRGRGARRGRGGAGSSGGSGQRAKKRHRGWSRQPNNAKQQAAALVAAAAPSLPVKQPSAPPTPQRAHDPLAQMTRSTGEQAAIKWEQARQAAGIQQPQRIPASQFPMQSQQQRLAFYSGTADPYSQIAASSAPAPGGVYPQQGAYAPMSETKIATPASPAAASAVSTKQFVWRRNMAHVATAYYVWFQSRAAQHAKTNADPTFGARSLRGRSADTPVGERIRLAMGELQQPGKLSSLMAVPASHRTTVPSAASADVSPAPQMFGSQFQGQYGAGMQLLGRSFPQSQLGSLGAPKPSAIASRGPLTGLPVGVSAPTAQQGAPTGAIQLLAPINSGPAGGMALPSLSGTPAQGQQQGQAAAGELPPLSSAPPTTSPIRMMSLSSLMSEPPQRDASPVGIPGLLQGPSAIEPQQPAGVPLQRMLSDPSAQASAAEGAGLRQLPSLVQQPLSQGFQAQALPPMGMSQMQQQLPQLQPISQFTQQGPAPGAQYQISQTAPGQLGSYNLVAGRMKDAMGGTLSQHASPLPTEWPPTLVQKQQQQQVAAQWMSVQQQQLQHQMQLQHQLFMQQQQQQLLISHHQALANQQQREAQAAAAAVAAGQRMSTSQPPVTSSPAALAAITQQGPPSAGASPSVSQRKVMQTGPAGSPYLSHGANALAQHELLRQKIRHEEARYSQLRVRAASQGQPGTSTSPPAMSAMPAMVRSSSQDSLGKFSGLPALPKSLPPLGAGQGQSSMTSMIIPPSPVLPSVSGSQAPPDDLLRCLPRLQTTSPEAGQPPHPTERMWRGKKSGGGGGSSPDLLVITRKSMRKSMRKTLRMADPERDQSASAAEAAAAGEQDTSRLRSLVIQEIVDTERKYLEDMYTFIVFFVHPLKTNFADLLATPEYTVLLVQFGTVETIFEMNTDFQTELQLRLEQSPDTAIGSTFIQLASSNLEYYSVFCNNQEAVLEKMKELQKNSHVRQFLQRCRASTRTNLDVIDYIVKPFQRVLKYPLLLKELLKYTDPSHSDYAPTVAALQKIQASIDRINNNKSYSDNLRRILDINKQIGSKDMNLVHPSRVFIAEGVFTKIVHGKSQTRHCFLFSDLIVFCQINAGNKLKLSAVFTLAKANFEDVPDTRDYQNAIRVTRLDSSSFGLLGEGNCSLLCCSTPEEKATWLKNLQQQKATAMADLQQKHAAALVEKTKSPTPQHASGTASPISSPLSPQLQAQLGRAEMNKALNAVLGERRRSPGAPMIPLERSSSSSEILRRPQRPPPAIMAQSVPVVRSTSSAAASSPSVHPCGAPETSASPTAIEPDCSMEVEEDDDVDDEDEDPDFDDDADEEPEEH